MVYRFHQKLVDDQLFDRFILSVNHRFYRLSESKKFNRFLACLYLIKKSIFLQIDDWFLISNKINDRKGKSADSLFIEYFLIYMLVNIWL